VERSFNIRENGVKELMEVGLPLEKAHRNKKVRKNKSKILAFIFFPGAILISKNKYNSFF